MARKFDLIIIGNGPAGNNAAEAALRVDPDISVLIMSKERQAEYSAPALPDYLSGELSLEKITINTFDDYIKKGISLHLGERIAKIDTEAKCVYTVSGVSFVYGKLIVATGGSPIQLRRMKGTGLPGNFVLKTVDDVDAIKAYPGKSAVVVGSGAIGLEGGLGLKEFGYENVTIVEALDWINKKSFDKVTADKVVKAINACGVEVLSGEAVEGVLGEDCVRGVKTSKRIIPCDTIIWGIGVRPEVTLAKETGIELGELGGIKVDDHMRTNIPDVYACGDCIESLDQFTGKPGLNLLWEPASREGIVAGENCAGKESIFSGSYPLFLTYIGDVVVVACGKTEDTLQDEDYTLIEECREDRYRRIILQEGKLVGVQMVNTMEDVDLLLNRLQKDCDAFSDASWNEEINVPEGSAFEQYVDFLERNRR